MSARSAACVCSCHSHYRTPCTSRKHTDPLAIIPLYSSVFNDAWRLVFCLLGHPLLLEICLFWMRGYERGFSPLMIERWNSGGKEAFATSAGNLAFIVEAILVLDRRFLIG